MSGQIIYLDNAATTKVFPGAAEIAVKYMAGKFYNPSALYGCALEVKNDIKAAANTIAGLLVAKPEEFVFTSGATESNNYALNSGWKNKKGNLVISGGEHASVYETAMKLKSSGREVRIAPLTSGGLVDSEKLLALIDDNTALVSVIHVSNETGGMNDIAALCRRVKDKNPKAVFHSDGVQAFCKINFNAAASGVDLYSISAHKVGGLKGVGALYIRNGFNMQAMISGGGQQDGRRSGTENVCGIVSFAAAAQEYKKSAQNLNAAALRQYMCLRIAGEVPFAVINDGGAENSGYILSVSFAGIKGEVLAHILEDKNIIIGLGSACAAREKQPRVLSQLGLKPKELQGSVRISFGPENTMKEIEYATEEIIAAAKVLKEKIDG